MPEEQGIALTWPELLERGCDDIDRAVTVTLPETIDRISRRGSVVVGPVARSIARIVICAGTERGKVVLDSASGALPGVMPEFRDGINAENAANAKGVLDFINILRCLGAPVSKEAADAEESWLAEIARFTKQFEEKRLNTLALAALATAQTELVPKFIGGGKLPASFKPGETFQFNVQGFVRYMAVAIDRGASADDVMPAFDEFVLVFPRKLATDTLDWIDLFWAARAVTVHLEKRDAGEVAQALYDYVRE